MSTNFVYNEMKGFSSTMDINDYDKILQTNFQVNSFALSLLRDCLLYTSDAADDTR